MNFKIIIGIFLPLILIVCLVIISALNIGFSLEVLNADSVEFSALYVDHSTENIPIQTIIIKNDFFLPKLFVLPKLVICLNDKDGLEEIQTMRAKYSKSIVTLPEYVEVFDYDYNSKQSIELIAKSTAQVIVMVEPRYSTNYYGEMNLYREYDELLLIEPSDVDRYDPNPCRNLDFTERNLATHIPIIR